MSHGGGGRAMAQLIEKLETLDVAALELQTRIAQNVASMLT